MPRIPVLELAERSASFRMALLREDGKLLAKVILSGSYRTGLCASLRPGTAPFVAARARLGREAVAFARSVLCGQPVELDEGGEVLPAEIAP
jgi:hypothetical protein